MKKVISIMLFISCIFTIIPSFAKGDNSYDIKIQTVLNLGIISGDEEGNLNLDKELTRAEFAIMVYNLINKEKSDNTVYASKQIYSDVDRWHWTAGYIEYLTNAGYINGFSDGTFRPNDTVLAVEAYKVLLNAAGYEEYAKTKGEYPNSYRIVAAEKGLLKGMSLGENKQLKRLDAGHLIYNLLYVRTMNPISYSDNEISFNEGEKFLTESLDIYEGIGVVTAIGDKSTNGKSAGKGNAIIGGFLITDDFNTLEGLLGYEVRYFYKYDEPDRNLVFALETTKNNIETIKSKDINSFSNNVYRFNKGENTEKAQISQTADVVVNNKMDTSYKNFIPYYGDVTLIDNNNDGNYDVVIITDYVNIIVENFDSKREIIYSKNLDKYNKKINIELDSFKNVDIRNEAGEVVEADTIKKDSVLTVATAGDEFISIKICNKTVSGVVTQKEDDSKNESITLDNGKQYMLAPNTYIPHWDKNIGQNLMLGFDVNGYVAYIEVENGGNYEFGYVLKMYAAEDLALTRQIKLVSQDGSVYIYQCDDNLEVDGVKNIKNEELLNKFDKPQLIRYSKRNGLIKSIDFARDKPMADLTGDKDELESSGNKLLKRAEGDMQFKYAIQSFKSYGSVSIPGDIPIDKNTIVFQVPARPDSFTEDSEYQVLPLTSLTDNMQKYVGSYNTDPTMLRSEVVVIKLDSGGAGISVGSHMMLVDKVINVVNKAEESSYQICGLIFGAYKGYTLKRPEYINYKGHPIKQGDVIRVATDKNEEVTAIEVVYNSYNSGVLNDSQLRHESPGGFDSPLRIILGYINSKEDSNLLFRFANDLYPPESFRGNMFNIYIYEKDVKDSKDRVRIGTYSEIVDFATDPEQYDTIIVQTINSSPTALVVVK